MTIVNKVRYELQHPSDPCSLILILLIGSAAVSAAPVPANNDNQILEHCLILHELNIIASIIVVDRGDTEVATSRSRTLMNILWLWNK